MRRHFDHRFSGVTKLRIGIEAPRDGQAYEVQRRGTFVFAEHHAPDLARADAVFDVQRVDEGDAWIFEWGDVRQERAGVDEDAVASGRAHDGHSGVGEAG